MALNIKRNRCTWHDGVNVFFTGRWSKCRWKSHERVKLTVKTRFDACDDCVNISYGYHRWNNIYMCNYTLVWYKHCGGDITWIRALTRTCRKKNSVVLMGRNCAEFRKARVTRCYYIDTRCCAIILLYFKRVSKVYIKLMSFLACFMHTKRLYTFLFLLVGI